MIQIDISSKGRRVGKTHFAIDLLKTHPKAVLVTKSPGTVCQQFQLPPGERARVIGGVDVERQLMGREISHLIIDLG
jgi:hypothetical protein